MRSRKIQVILTNIAMKSIRSVAIWALISCSVLQAQESRIVWQPVLEYMLRDGKSPMNASKEGKVTMNPFVAYTHIGTDFGFQGPGERFLSWDNGHIKLGLKGSADWAGMWHSLAGQARDDGDVLDFARAYGGAVADKWQPKIVSLLVRCSGTGTLKLEIRSPNQETLWEKRIVLDGSSGNPLPLPISPQDVRLAKFLNWAADAGSEISLTGISLGLEMPPMSFEQYVLLSSYAKLFRCYSMVTGLVKDRAHVEQGAFDSTPATGFFGLATAVMAHPSVGMVDPEFAKFVIRKIRTNMDGVPKASGLLPHFMKRLGGQLMIHPGTEFSTVDTAIYSQAMLLAAQIIDDKQTAKAVLEDLRAVDIKSLVGPDGAISHGLRTDGRTRIPFYWRDWGGETALVMLMARMIDPKMEITGMDGGGRAWQGTGFIAEIQSLLHPDFDSTSPDALSRVNWRAARLTMLSAQKSYFPRHLPDSFAARMGLYGLSAGEGPFGTNYEVGGVDLPSQMLIHPHYILMSGCLEAEPQDVYTLLARMEHSHFMTPWGLVENIGADGRRYLPMFSGLNAAFEALGAYHLMVKANKTEDIVYKASRECPEIREAMRLFYPSPMAKN